MKSRFDEHAPCDSCGREGVQRYVVGESLLCEACIPEPEEQ
jgi:hypothetical protein